MISYGSPAFALLLFISFGCSSQENVPIYNGLQLIQSANGYCAANVTDSCVLSFDTLLLDHKGIMDGIRQSTIPDRELICAVLAMHKDDRLRQKEILHLCRNYDEIALMVLRQADAVLKRE